MQTFHSLLQQFEERLKANSPFPDSPSNLYDPCRYLLSLGGKRVRPVLCLMASDLFGDITEDSFRAAMGIELFHNFTLIHDDIMDKAPLRRGQPTIHNKYGLTAGILSGDVMSITAYDYLCRIQHHLPAVLQLFNKTAIEVCEGQQLDMDYELHDHITVDEYIKMITLKTSVLLAASLKMGALIGGATEGASDKLYAFGKNLGIAFQLQDDYLDAFGDIAVTGKQAGGDILANKKTFLLLNALENGNEEQQSTINELLKGNEDNKVPQMLDLFRQIDADEACRDAVRLYSARAFDCLEEVAVLSKRKEPLKTLAQQLLQRES